MRKQERKVESDSLRQRQRLICWSFCTATTWLHQDIFQGLIISHWFVSWKPALRYSEEPQAVWTFIHQWLNSSFFFLNSSTCTNRWKRWSDIYLFETVRFFFLFPFQQTKQKFAHPVGNGAEQCQSWHIQQSRTCWDKACNLGGTLSVPVWIHDICSSHTADATDREKDG